MQLRFTAHVTPEPQGSVKAFVMADKEAASRAHARGTLEAIIEACKRSRAILTSDNTKLKAYRAQVAKAAKDALWEANIDYLMADKHVPMAFVIEFYLERPESCPKTRRYPSVRPDIDKLVRSTLDALKGVLYLDDAQVVDVAARKNYGTPERVEVSCSVMESLRPQQNGLFPPEIGG